MNVKHLSTDEFIAHLEIYSDSDILKKALSVINELKSEGDYYKIEHAESEHFISEIEKERDNAIEEAEEATEKLREIRQIINR